MFMEFSYQTPKTRKCSKFLATLTLTKQASKLSINCKRLICMNIIFTCLDLLSLYLKILNDPFFVTSKSLIMAQVYHLLSIQPNADNNPLLINSRPIRTNQLLQFLIQVPENKIAYISNGQFRSSDTLLVISSFLLTKLNVSLIIK